MAIFSIFNITNGFSQNRIDFNIYGSFLYPSRFYISKNYIDSDFNYPNKGKDYFDNEFIDEANKNESTLPSFSVGFSFNKHILKRIEIQLGFEYSQIREKNDIVYFETFDFYDNTIVIAHNSYVIYNFNYLTLPLGFSFKCLEYKKIDIIPSLGINLDCLLNSSMDNNPNDSLYKFTSKIENERYEYKTLTASLSFRIEIGYNLSEKYKFFFRPVYNQSIITNCTLNDKYYMDYEFHSRDIIKRFNYYIGIQAGIRFLNILK